MHTRLRKYHLLKLPLSCLVVDRMCDYGILYSLSDHEQRSKTSISFSVLHTSVASDCARSHHLVFSVMYILTILTRSIVVVL